ncbi:hypothetical protein [Ideonella azotifigens]|uniref:Apea-like HEPN domain-containing protein n=2 Tax=Ideonella azotifigens TaxID=513160 RepID=A0ABP3VFG9_9BURK|nr:hypothetical protein [Ideonella azotifigens]
MSLTLSNRLTQAMGFRELAEAESISASFSSITVYEARGIALAEGTTEVSQGRVAGVDYRLAVGSSVNSACTALVADVFVDNEEEWKKETKSQGPFILVQIGPTREHKCDTGRIKREDDGSVTTYDCFPNVRIELSQFESRALPPIVSGLTCVLNEENRYVELRKLERASVGRTASGVVVNDIRMQLHAELYTAYNLQGPQLAGKLEAAREVTTSLNAKAARFFALGLGEKDQLKRFLYFFLALEVETHAVYGRIDHASELCKLLSDKGSHGQAATKLLQTQVDNLKNLYDRFVWCATCVWSKLNDTDISQFKLLKGARDDIAHGSTSEPPVGFARQAELLARKVLWSANT